SVERCAHGGGLCRRELPGHEHCQADWNARNGERGEHIAQLEPWLAEPTAQARTARVRVQRFPRMAPDITPLGQLWKYVRRPRLLARQEETTAIERQPQP